MKTKKYITKATAQKATRGVIAVFAAIAFTVLSVATGVVLLSSSYNSVFAYTLIGLLGINAISLWAVVFSKKSFGLALSRIIQIIELVATSLLSVLVGILLFGKISGFDIVSLVARYVPIDGETISSLTLPGIIACFCLVIFILIYRCSALGVISAADRAYKGKCVRASGRLFYVLSKTVAVVFITAIPVRLFFSELAQMLKLDTSVINLKELSINFAEYSLADYALVVELIFAPLSYALLGSVAKKLSEYSKNATANESVVSNPVNEAVEESVVEVPIVPVVENENDCEAQTTAMCSDSDEKSESVELVSEESIALPVTIDDSSPSFEPEETETEENLVEVTETTEEAPIVPIAEDVCGDVTIRASEEYSADEQQEIIIDVADESSENHTDEIIEDFSEDSFKSTIDNSINTCEDAEAVSDEALPIADNSVAFVEDTYAEEKTASESGAVVADASPVIVSAIPDTVIEHDNPVYTLSNNTSAMEHNASKSTSVPFIAGTHLFDFGYSENSII